MPDFTILGRPKKYRTEKEFRDKVNEYFDTCDNEKEPYTKNGLGLFVGLDRHQIDNYSRDTKFYYTIRQALQRIAHDLERRAITQGNSSGPIFLLKNMGYSDNMQHRLAGHDGNELKWKIEVVRGRGDSLNRPPLRRGLAAPERHLQKPVLITDNTKQESQGENIRDDKKPEISQEKAANLLPGVVDFSRIRNTN